MKSNDTHRGLSFRKTKVPVNGLVWGGSFLSWTFESVWQLAVQSWGLGLHPLGLVFLTTTAWVPAAVRVLSSGEESEPGNTSTHTCSDHMISVDLTITRSGLRRLLPELDLRICLTFFSPFVTILRAWLASTRLGLLNDHSLGSSSSKGTVFRRGVRAWEHKYTYTYMQWSHDLSRTYHHKVWFEKASSWAGSSNLFDSLQSRCHSLESLACILSAWSSWRPQLGFQQQQGYCL